jgi:multisubunit Na+/H+ antiporter MnhC subunit
VTQSPEERVVRTPVESGDRNGRIGFAPMPRRKPGQRRARALVQLIAATGLVISLAVAATAVSIGIARANTDATATLAR